MKMVAPWRSSKAELIRGKGYLFLMIIFVQATEVKAGMENAVFHTHEEETSTKGKRRKGK